MAGQRTSWTTRVPPALPDWHTLTRLADALVARSSGEYRGWGVVVLFAACTAARIGEVSGCRVKDIDTDEWTWTVRRQTTPSPGGLVDKGTKGKRARTVPLIEEIRELVQQRMAAVNRDPEARCSPGLAAAGSPRRCSETRRAGKTS